MGIPYQGGYSLNVYGQDTHKKSRILSEKLGTIIAQGIVGKPQKWTENTFKNMRKKLYQKTGALAVLQEGQPQLNFTFKEEPVAATRSCYSTCEPACKFSTSRA